MNKLAKKVMNKIKIMTRQIKIKWKIKITMNLKNKKKSFGFFSHILLIFFYIY